ISQSFDGANFTTAIEFFRSPKPCFTHQRACDFSARLAVAPIDRSRCARSPLQTVRPPGNANDDRTLWLCRRPDHLRVLYCQFHFRFTPESGLRSDIAPGRFCAKERKRFALA
ncbi:MAG: hypothetical protein WBF73_07075, partial [Bradyrhizobium sp.]